jgi:hypothetical protein
MRLLVPLLALAVMLLERDFLPLPVPPAEGAGRARSVPSNPAPSRAGR